jgi:hypothetical protein
MWKMRPVETVLSRGEGKRRMMDGVTLIKIYWKHFSKCHNVPSVQE